MRKFKQKKIVVLLLSLILTIGMVTTTYGAEISSDATSRLGDEKLESTERYDATQFNVMAETFDVDECFDIATTALREFYEEIDLGIPAQLNTEVFADSSLYDYIINKISIKSYIAEEADLPKENYNLSFNLLSVNQANGNCQLTIQAEAIYNYVNIDVQSGFGKVSEITFSMNGNQCHITDWYDPYDDYDTVIRENRAIEIVDDTISVKQAKYLETIEEYFENEFDTIHESVQLSPSVPSSRATLYNLNKSAIVSWARNNIVSSPSSGGSSVPYYDFSQISGNYDCTNFVSHALLAGGAVPYVTTSGTSPRSTGWYYTNLSNRSSSWSGVTNLYNFITANTTKGPTGVGISYTTHIAPGGSSPVASAPYDLGDILQFHNGSIWRHSTIITSIYQINTTTYGALVTGRSGNGSYNNNATAESIYAGNSKRVIRLYGYYK